MKKNKYKIIILLAVVLLPVLAWAGNMPIETAGSLLKFLKGDGAFEKWFMEAFTKLDTEVESTTYSASLLGRAIGGIGAMIYLAFIGWQMQAGERNWDITPMIRPIIIGLILLHWPSFVKLIQVPLEKISAPSEAIFKDIEEDVNDVRIARFAKQVELMDFLIAEQSTNEAKNREIEALEQGSDKGFFEDSIEKLLAPIYEFKIRMNFEIQSIIASVIEAIGITILRVCTYLIFFIQKIWSYILIVLGPIAVGLSLIPGFEAAFGNWLSKFININLYTFIAYVIINIGQQLIVAGYKMEIDRYDEMLSTGEANLQLVLAYVSNQGMIYSTLFPVVAYIVTGISVLMVPTIADQIVTAGGSGVFTKAKGVVRNAVKTAAIAVA